MLVKNALEPFETFDDKEENLRYVWIAFTTHMDKGRALWFAYNGKKFLDKQRLRGDTEHEMLESAYRKGLGYQMVAMAFVWNNWFEEAFEIEGRFLSEAYWKAFASGIEQYLEMLIIKRQIDHLITLFADKDFKYRFLTHYEVFISFLVDPNYRLTKMSEFVTLANKVAALNRSYGDGFPFVGLKS